MSTPIDAARYFEVFFNYIRLLLDIPEHDQALCRYYFKPVFAKKDSLIAKEGRIPKYHNFIVSGYMRNFHYDDEGREITTDISDGSRFFTSYTHFMDRTISNENLHCITDCELLRIDRNDVDEMAKVGITQLIYSEKILRYHLAKNNQRILDLTTLSAEERYLKLLNTQPSILQHIPLKYIASYLGINPGSLSRIRKEIGSL